jgi:hypothetical protein
MLQRVLLFLLLTTLGVGFVQAAAKAGQVVLATGESFKLVQGGEEKRIPLRRGDDVYEGDAIETGNGSLVIKMIDNAIVAMPSMSLLEIQDYRAASDTQPAQIRFELKKGAIRTRTGDIGKQNPNNYRLNTPFAALGIRGTDYTVSVSGGEFGAFVHDGAVRVSVYDEQDCRRSDVGPCDDGVGKELSANSGYWLRVKDQQIEAVDGLPDFISSFQNQNLDQLLLNNDNNPIVPERMLVQQLSSSENPVVSPQIPTSPPAEVVIDGDIDISQPLLLLEEKLLFSQTLDVDEDGLDNWLELRRNLNPWHRDTDKDGSLDNVDPLPLAPSVYWWTDKNPSPLTSSQLSETISSLSLTSSLFNIDSASWLNTNHNYFNDREISTWWSANGGLFWGELNSQNTLLYTRNLPTGDISWSGPKYVFNTWGLSGESWVTDLASNSSNVQLLSLPAKETQLSFDSDFASAPSETRQFKVNWTQPRAVPADYRLDTEDAWNLNNINVSPTGNAVAQFSNKIGTMEVNGAANSDGVVWFDTDQVSLRAIIINNSIVAASYDKVANQEQVYGLIDNGLTLTPASTAIKRTTNDIEWGFWSDYSVLSPAQLQALGLENDSETQQNSYFAFKGSPIDNLEAYSGSISFALKDSQAIFVNENNVYPATVKNPYLKVDFDRSRFVAYLGVDAPTLFTEESVWGGGTLSETGSLVGDASISNADFKGQITSSEEAVLLFEKELQSGGVISGITLWEK